MLNLNAALRAGLLLASVSFVSCSSPKLYASYNDKLVTASRNFEERRYAEVARQTQDMLIDSAPQSSTYRLQRFFAAYLLTRAHMQASFDAPFLKEPRTGENLFALASSGDGNQVASPLAHLVSTIYHASLAREWANRVTSSPFEVDGQKLVPDDLALLGIENAFNHLLLCQLTVYSRLQFDEKVSQMVESPQLRSLQEFAACERMVDTARVSPEMEPWIYYALFEFIKRSDETAAYKYGIQALAKARQLDSDAADFVGEVELWITDGSKYRFYCPQCKEAVVPRTDSCLECRVSNLEFEFERKPRE